MPATLRLALADDADETRWRWVLTDARGRLLADFEVRLDPQDPEYRGFADLHGWLDFHQPWRPPAEQLKDPGLWIGERVFGGSLKAALLGAARQPVVAVRLEIRRGPSRSCSAPLSSRCSRAATGRPWWGSASGPSIARPRGRRPGRRCPAGTRSAPSPTDRVRSPFPAYRIGLIAFADESPHYNTTVATIAKLCCALGCQPGDLLVLEPDNRHEPQD